MRVSAVVLTGFSLAAMGTGGTANSAPQVRAKVPANAQCTVLAKSIDETVKDMSAVEADGLVDDSAPRATMRAADIGSKQTEIQNNILLMQANHCSPYSLPLSPRAYLLSAITCNTAMMKTHNDKMEESMGVSVAPPKADEVPVSVSCDRTRWHTELKQ